MENSADSRRRFLKKAGLFSAGITILPSYPFKGFFLPHPKAQTVKREVRPVDGKWVPVVCWHDCGGRCALKAMVFNNKIIRVKSDDSHEDSPDYPQQRACVRGRSQRMQVCSPDRLKYPMRLKHWVLIP